MMAHPLAHVVAWPRVLLSGRVANPSRIRRFQQRRGRFESACKPSDLDDLSTNVSPPPIVAAGGAGARGPSVSGLDASILVSQACCANIVVGYSASTVLHNLIGAAGTAGGGGGGAAPPAAALELVAAACLGASLQALCTWLLAAERIKEQLTLGNSSLGTVVLQGAAGAAAAAAVVGACAQLTGGASSDGSTAQLSTALASLGWGALPALVLSEAVLAPAVEESIFRGVLLRALLAGTPAPVAIAIQAAAFATYHFNAAEWLPLFALGGVLGCAYTYSGRSLPVSVASHAFYNAAALSLLLGRGAVS